MRTEHTVGPQLQGFYDEQGVKPRDEYIYMDHTIFVE